MSPFPSWTSYIYFSEILALAGFWTSNLHILNQFKLNFGILVLRHSCCRCLIFGLHTFKHLVTIFLIVLCYFNSKYLKWTFDEAPQKQVFSHELFHFWQTYSQQLPTWVLLSHSSLHGYNFSFIDCLIP